MIENILFDLSEVILTGAKEIEVAIAKKTGRDYKEIFEDFVCFPYWDMLLTGEISEEEFFSGLIKRGNYNLSLQEFKDMIRANFQEIPGMKEKVIDLKQQGFNLGLLSDHAREWVSYIEKKFPVVQEIPKRKYSFELGETKKNVSCFLRTLESYSWEGEYTLFIDDSRRNVNCAAISGIGYTHRFTSKEGLTLELSRLRELGLIER